MARKPELATAMHDDRAQLELSFEQPYLFTLASNGWK